MKRMAGIGLALALMGMVPVQAAEPFEAGRHYRVLPNPQAVETGEKIELREFFWYGCPHCFALEPTLEGYVAKLPKNVAFVRTPGVAPRWLIHGQAFYAFEVLGVTAKLHAPFFEAWHVKKRQFNDVDSIAEFAAEHGVDKQKFVQAFNSFSVRTRLQRAKQRNVAFQVDGVPMLAVDGRYVTSPAMAGSEKTAMQVVDFLIQKAAEERKKSAAR